MPANNKKSKPKTLLGILGLLALAYFIKLAVENSQCQEYHDAVNMHMSEADYEKVVDNIQKAINVYQKRRFYQEELTISYCTKAYALLNLKQPQASLVTLHQAIESVKPTKKFGSLRQALQVTYIKQKWLYIDQQQYSEARAFFEKEKKWVDQQANLYATSIQLEAILKEISYYQA